MITIATASPVVMSPPLAVPLTVTSPPASAVLMMSSSVISFTVTVPPISSTPLIVMLTVKVVPSGVLTLNVSVKGASPVSNALTVELVLSK